MKKIPSFTIDHLRLVRGIYVSRQDQVGGDIVTTFDIRMKEPNREPALGQGALHTIEHLAATFLRNHPTWADKIVYWGPMGCLTGNYLLVKGDLSSADILPLMQETFRFIADYEGEIPGATAKDCGNYLLQDLPMARWEARKYLTEVLDVATEENLVYPAETPMMDLQGVHTDYESPCVHPFLFIPSRPNRNPWDCPLHPKTVKACEVSASCFQSYR